MILINGLGAADIVFFSVCAGIIGVIVAIYFLIPVFNKKQYEEQRESLRKREAVFRSNLKPKDADPNTSEDSIETKKVFNDEE